MMITVKRPRYIIVEHELSNNAFALNSINNDLKVAEWYSKNVQRNLGDSYALRVLDCNKGQERFIFGDMIPLDQHIVLNLIKNYR